MGDKTDEIRERTEDGTVGGTVDDDSDAVLTLDTTGDEQPSDADDDSDSESSGGVGTGADSQVAPEGGDEDGN